ncbi:MAG TPA: L-threonylcarbamoyladenylate synthase [Clostridia bacterium]|nr:L-threonylcarbamoyladenylate synthase [Clostridia bacterium]
MTETKIVKISPCDSEKLKEAADIIKNGGVVGIPTETVYGLAANAYDENAVKKIFMAKGRPQDNPLIVHIGELTQLYEVAANVPINAEKLVQQFMPGPLTIILPKSERVPDIVTAGLKNVAVRMPLHKTAREFIKYCGVPLAAPSANISGGPSPTSAQHVYDDLNGKIPLIIDGGECAVGVESTVISLIGDIPELLRPGAITIEQLEEVLGVIKVNPAILEEVNANEKVSSPGLLHKHYSPKTRLIAVKGNTADFAKYVNAQKDKSVCALVFDEDKDLLEVPYIVYGKKNDYHSQEHALFKSLRQIDELKKDICYAELPNDENAGLAVLNRLLRAAEFSVVNAKKIFIIVGLTGKTGSGKSTVSRILEEKGTAIIDGDKVAREVLAEDNGLLQKLSGEFGNSIIKDGVLDRKALAFLAFKDKESTERLNSITHPHITKAVYRKLSELKNKGVRVVVIDAAALIESKISEKCDIIVVTHAPYEERLKRICERDGLTEKEALLRISAQKEDDFYISKADYLINNFYPNSIEEQLKPLLKRLGL